MAAPLSVEVEFGGGAELLFDGVKKHQVTLPGQEEPWDIRNLLVWIKKNLLKERPELFIQGDSVQSLLAQTCQENVGLGKVVWLLGYPAQPCEGQQPAGHHSAPPRPSTAVPILG
nr:ubiquitin-related modifier 1 isoform X1 [Cavia porcellus]